MNDYKLKLLVTEAVKLDRLVAQLTEKLKGYKAEIAAEADSRQEEAQPTEGGGTSLTLEGIDGAVCRVTMTGRALKSSINAEGPLWDKIRKALDGRVPVTVFTPEVSYKPGENFRERVVDILGKAEGNKLIKLCENAGKTTVSFETKEAS